MESFRRREVEEGGRIVPASHPNRTSGRTGITSDSSRKVGNAPLLQFLTFYVSLWRIAGCFKELMLKIM
jgi:hypothetical protein